MQKLRWPMGRRGRETAPEFKGSRAGPLIALTSGGRARWTPRDYAHLAVEGFGKNAVAYRCVRMIAEAAASTPLIVFAAEQGRRTIRWPDSWRSPTPSSRGANGWRDCTARCKRRATPTPRRWGRRSPRSFGRCGLIG